MKDDGKKMRPISTYSFTPVASQDGYDNSEDYDEDDTRCGVACFKPNSLQVFSRPIVFLIVFCVVGMIQGAFFTYFIGIITTVEKRYMFKSKTTGIISIADNLSPIFTSLVIGFFGGRGHKTRWLAFGTVISALSSFVSAVPYLVFGSTLSQVVEDDAQHLANSTSANSQFSLCIASGEDENCEELLNQRFRETWTAVGLLFLGNFINGIGSTTFYVVGTPYLDDNIDKAKTPLYFAIMFSVRLIGPSLGFVMASQVLQIYEDPLLNPEFGMADPRWVGAWWIGFNVIAVLLLLAGGVLVLFPKELKWGDKKSGQNTVNIPKTSFSQKMKEFPKSIAVLLRNPILMCQNASLVFYILGMLGFFLFYPKYLESHFRQPPGQANIVTGVASIGFMALGFLISGFTIYKIRPSPRYLSGYNVLVGTIQIGAVIALGTISCQNQEIQMPQGNGTCGSGCDCGTHTFAPVCDGNSSVTYFTPCYAGCTNTYLDADNKRVYDDCSCSEEVLTTGYCSDGCQMLLVYIIIMSVSQCIGSTGRIGNALITLRCVSPEDKSLAMSTTSFFMSLFALIPYPLVYGAIVDSVCIQWETKCGKTGNCWIYDSEMFRIKLHGFTAGFFILSTFFDLLVWHFTKKMGSLYEDPPSLSPVTKNNKRSPRKTSNLSDTVRYNWAGSKTSITGFN